MPDFVNTGSPVDVYRVDPLHVDAGQTITVPGDLVTEGAPEDAFLVRNNGSDSLWPMSRWQLKQDVKPSKKSGSQPADTAAPAAEGN